VIESLDSESDWCDPLDDPCRMKLSRIMQSFFNLGGSNTDAYQ